MDLKEKLISDYRLHESKLNGFARGKIYNIKLDAERYFELLGFPNRKQEDWRFTNVNPIITNNYNYDLGAQPQISEEDLQNFLVPGLKANTIVFINGIYSDKHSKIITEKGKAYIGTIKDTQKSNKELIEKYFAGNADYKTDGFTALNTAYMNDGVFIHVSKNTEIKEPVLILNITDSSKGEIMYHPRVLLVAGESSKVSLIEIYESDGENFSFSNAVTEIYSENNSEVHYYKIQNECDKSYHVGTTQVRQERDSRFNSLTVSWGGSVIRNNLNASLQNKGADTIMKGLFIASGNQQIDNHTLVDHASPYCHSNELYKGIMDENSNGVFNGKIMVRKDAQKTNAYQMNKNIILSKSALVNSKPQLEIFADDVKCSHGATTGQLDNEQLFYLKARGIGEKEGKKLLLYAFANEILEDIPIDDLKVYLEKKLSEKLEKK